MPSCSVCQKTLFLTIWWFFDPLKKQRPRIYSEAFAIGKEERKMK